MTLSNVRERWMAAAAILSAFLGEGGGSHCAATR
jgi:hypothetical protein